MSSTQIAKFGGTSMADAEAIRACVKLIESQAAATLVVVSACAGVTNRLVMLSQSRAQVERQRLGDEIIQKHNRIAEQLSADSVAIQKLQTLHQQLQQLVLSELPQSSLMQERRRDAILSFGERCASELFAACWRQYQPGALAIDATELLKTDNCHGNANPELAATRHCCQYLQDKLSQGAKLVTQGFIGSDETGQLTTLGRGGSDYSAAIFAAALNAEQLNIWTDVAGIYTTDPRICADARPLPEISFAEAAELATFGAKVLHPKSLKPAIENSIPVFVGHSRYPERGGSLVVAEPQSRPSIRALACRRNQTLLTVSSVDMLHATGFLARLFDILARYTISVDLVTTSEVSIALTLDEAGCQANGQSLLPEAMLDELRQFAVVEIEQGLALIAVIGNDIGHSGDISPHVLQAASPNPVRLICQGASRHNLCFLVADEGADQIIRNLHTKL
ncbi:lysine-sensitive aspartokinase 3 [Idiomarina seosinensis]|uniref:lysine-sensitive aspartokinase 3 n=1 Tax=Idiomarina seosinensis TaxID=281739 RepID=UPI00384CC574